MNPHPQLTPVCRRGADSAILGADVWQNLDDRIKEIESKIREIELRRERSVMSSQRPSPCTSNESPNADISTLESGSQSPSPPSAPDRFPHTASKSPSQPMLNTPWFDSGVLSYKGSLNLNLPVEVSNILCVMFCLKSPSRPTQTRASLNMFMQRRSISGFELHIDRVIKSFQPGRSDAPVPALLYTILLLGCHFIPDPELKFWESVLFERAKLEIDANITRAHANDSKEYNPLHHLQAMVMLGQWFYLKNRLLEGHVFIVRATRFAAALGLHELDSCIYGHYVARVMGSSKRKMGRWSPRDSVELGEAINLWWACFERDYGGSLINGLPPSISLKDIKTGWPVALADFEAVDVGTLASLLDIRYYHAIGDVSQDSSNCILAKCVTLVHCAGMLDTERISGSEVTDEWWARFEECDRAIDIFTTSVQRAYVNRDIQEVAIIALSHTAVDSATIQLHGPLADYELQIGAQGDPRGIRPDNSLGGYSYTRCIEACRSIALITAYIENIDINHMQMFFGVSLSCAAQVLAEQIPRLRESGHTAQAQEMERQISVIAKSMEKLFVIYPVLALQAGNLSSVMSTLCAHAASSEIITLDT
ncbi:chromatin disassembly [Rhizoctonia solani]|uniref:Chromatin disassembly n=1 Tax=Rhizoctonia solani TaxID=456999 RepID=A0A8H7LIR7_9AGAM|nr:chromatin disassembly [Rhizoctonia solani]